MRGIIRKHGKRTDQAAHMILVIMRHRDPIEMINSLLLQIADNK